MADLEYLFNNRLNYILIFKKIESDQDEIVFQVSKPIEQIKNMKLDKGQKSTCT